MIFIEEAKNKKKAPVGTAAAFVAGAAVGAAAGLMTKKKNRQKITKVAKKARNQAEIKARKGLDRAKELTDQVKTRFKSSEEEEKSE